MTYIIDLQRLWEDRQQITPSLPEAKRNETLDPRQLHVSVIMVLDKPIQRLSKKLITLLKEPLVREVLLVDCRYSKDSQHNPLIIQHPKCTYIQGKPSLSLVEAYQLAVRRAAGYLVLFLKAEETCSQKTLLQLIATGLRKPRPWVVGTGQEALHPFASQAQSVRQLPEVFLSGGGIHVPAVSGNCMLMPTTDYWELKGFDPACGASSFHRDLCMRVHLSGGGVYQIADVPESLEKTVLSEKTLSWQAKWLSVKGFWHYYQKHYSKKTNFSFGFDKLLMLLKLTCQLLSKTPKV